MAIIALGVFVLASFNVTGTGQMIAMPVVITKDGAELSSKDIKLLEYAFRESKTSFEGISHDALQPAKPLQKWFLVDAPFSVIKTTLRKTTKPEYRSLTLRLALVDGQTFTLSIPVVSDAELNTPIQIDISTKQAVP